MKILCYVKEDGHKDYMLFDYLHEMSRTGKFLKTESTLVVAWSVGEKEIISDCLMSQIGFILG